MLPSATTDPDASDDETQVDTYRTSKSVWYSSDFNDTTKKITERLGDATGLDMNSTEFYQVINYGLGGFFETHLDMLLSEKNRFNGTSDRIATTLFYVCILSFEKWLVKINFFSVSLMKFARAAARTSLD